MNWLRPVFYWLRGQSDNRLKVIIRFSTKLLEKRNGKPSV